MTRTLKEAILGALEAEVDYLRAVARENPTVFCALLAKVLPLTVPEEKAAEVPMVTKIVFHGMEPVPFRNGDLAGLEKLPIKQTCD